MEMKWPSSPPSAEDENLTTSVLLTTGPLSMEEAIREVQGTNRGAMVAFSGCVRDVEQGKPISAITYEAYAPMAEKELRKIIEDAEKNWDVKTCVRHRVGRVPVGEASVVVACSGGHRAEAFEACRFVIEELKKKVPLWKVRFEGL